MTESSFTIVVDLQCIQCAYNLRGLATDKLCPECGTPIERSRRGDLLNDADPDWLKKLRLGVSVKVCSMVLVVVLPIALGILIRAGLIRAGLGMYIAVFFLGNWMQAGLALWASILITTRERRIRAGEDSIILRRTIRLCAAVGFAGAVLQNPIVTINLDPQFAMMDRFCSLGILVAAIGELVYLRRFALRIPKKRLAKSTQILTWALAITTGLAVTDRLAPVVFYDGRSLRFLWEIAMIAMVLCSLWYVFLLLMYINAFKQAEMKARAFASSA